jgi:ethanolamine utilization microcompartment shell protein EutS
VEFRSESLDIRLMGALGTGSEGTLVRDSGWAEYLLEINNRGTIPLTVRNVKLLTSSGRYLDSASQYEEITVPPDAASEIAEDIAVRSAGIAAGRVVPYGGTIVGILSGAVSVSESESEASAQREFALRKLKDVELAPGGRVQGSAFLPRINGAQALVVDWERGKRSERVELALNGYP